MTTGQWRVKSCLGEFLVQYLFTGSVLSFNKELKPVLVALGILQGEHTVPFPRTHSCKCYCIEI